MERSDYKKIIFSMVAVMLLMGVIGGTYAFFNYTRTGISNTIKVGRINFTSEQESGNTIDLTNAFPISRTDALTDENNTGEVVINIEGDTDYSSGVEYLVTLTDVENTVGSGANAKHVPIGIIVSTDGTLGTESSTYYTARNSTNTSIYKIEAENNIEEDGRLMVGYIAPNQTPGTASGIEGSISIVAFIDSDNLAVSDTTPEGTVRTVITTNYSSSDCETALTGVTNASTYCATAASLQSAIDNSSLTDAQVTLLVNAGIVEEYTDGTTSEWVHGRTVLTTDEWNSLQTNGISFKVKVEANEGIWVENPNTLVNIMKRNTQLDTGLDFTQPSSYNNEGNGNGIYTLASSASSTNPIMYYRGAVDNNNVYFGGFCWQIVRTTETGGVKLIYNGAATVSGDTVECNATGAATQLSGTYSFSGTNLYTSLAYNGYMWGTVYEYIFDSPASGSIFGTSFVYENGEYKLSAGESGTVAAGYANGRHYTCNLTDVNGTCESIRYYFYTNRYISLTGGDGVAQALAKMKTTGVKANDTSSTTKQTIDTWYSTNMNSYTSMLEDTIWCNDRSSTDLGGWSESGTTTDNLYFSAYTRLSEGTSPPSLTCSDPVDRYTVSSSNGNGLLDYPVGMITADELVLAGSIYNTQNQTFYLKTGRAYWSMSPIYAYYNHTYGFVLTSIGSATNGYVEDSDGIRPMVSLKSGTEISGGTGLKTDPYIIE